MLSAAKCSNDTSTGKGGETEKDVPVLETLGRASM
jgi:hypothetical protein